jgi:hypothetical protein
MWRCHRQGEERPGINGGWWLRLKKNTGMDDIDYMWWYLLMVGGISWD